MVTATAERLKRPVNIKAVDVALWQEVRVAAVSEQMTMGEYVERALREALKKGPKPGRY